MHKRILYILLGTLACTYAYAQSFCNKVQAVGTYYEDTIETPGTYYFSAMTFDLPMDVSFTSLDPNCSEVPQIWADLTCTPGIYSDPNIQALVKDTVKYGVSVPMSITCQTDTIDGHYVHHLKLGKSYKNKLQLVGVDYSVPAYVKVILPCGGVAHMEQDTSSQACINDARRIALTDGTRVLANDSLSTYILPFKTWLTGADSVALSWEGPEPAHIWLNGNNCEFEIDVQHSWDNFIIPANGEVHLPKDYLNLGVKEVQDTAGYLFAKIFSAEEGTFSSRPLVPETKGATLLNYDSIQHVTIADRAFFCFPKAWTDIEWVANTRRVVKLFLHSSPELAPVDSFYFDLQDTTIRRVLQWTKPEMNLLRTYASSELLFVRFECSGDFTFTPYELTESSSCLNSAIRVRSGQPIECAKDKLFGLKYDEWKDYPMEIRWETPEASNLQNLYFLDTCKLTIKPTWTQTSYSTKVRTVYYKQTQRGGETWMIDSATIAGWIAKRPPVDGFYYIQMLGTGTLTITNARPAEQDPDDGLPLDPEIPDVPTSIDQQEVILPCRKILHNGQILIIRAGKAYTITGQTVKIE